MDYIVIFSTWFSSLKVGVNLNWSNLLEGLQFQLVFLIFCNTESIDLNLDFCGKGVGKSFDFS